MYDDVDMGMIDLKPWMMFVDKEHFKDTLRDYCIQEGVALVVRRSEGARYTIECADERCERRIHASRLPDGHTWAIKTLKLGHKCDLNLVQNPMITCVWAAKKLLESFRLNTEMKGKTIKGLLCDRVWVDNGHIYSV